MSEENGYSKNNYKRHYVFSWAIIGFFIGLILVTVYLFWLAFIPRPIFSFVQQPFIVQEDTVVAGGEIHMARESCRIRQADTTTEISLESDGLLVYLATQESHSNSKMGCSSKTNIYTIPIDLQPGTWKMVFDMSHKVTVLRTQHIRYESEEFEVVESPVKAIVDITSQVESGVKLELHINQKDGTKLVLPVEIPPSE